MNEQKANKLTINANYIETFEINLEIASDCKLRSKFVHEKIIQAKTKEPIFAVSLLISEAGLRVVRPSDQIVLSSHSIQRISYSACDRVNNLFALVVRCVEVDRSQICFIFRMNTPEQAESANRYFGAVFKHLNSRRKDRKYKCSQNNAEKVTEFASSPRKTGCNSMDNDLRPEQIASTEEMVVLTQRSRRLSLSMPSTDCDDEEVDDGDQLHPLHSSLEARESPIVAENAVARPFVRRKKPEYKGNRISAVIERLSFRVSREMSSDILKSGSPVVALKEQIEYEELLSADSSLASASDTGVNSHVIPHSQSRGKQLVSSNSNLCINSDSIAVNPVKNNLSPHCGVVTDPQSSEEPPVPPTRIHSLRNIITGQIRAPAHLAMHEYDDNDDFSSITTPSSCGPTDKQPIKFSVADDTGGAGPSGHCGQYFMDLNKEQAMDCLLDREVGSFLLRPSGSYQGCMALSVKVGPAVVSHYIIEPPGRQPGYRMKGLDKTWPDLEALVTHLSVMPELLPCPITVAARSRLVMVAAGPPQSRSVHDEYQHRIHHFLADVGPGPARDQYQSLSEFSSLVAGLDS